MRSSEIRFARVFQERNVRSSTHIDAEVEGERPVLSRSTSTSLIPTENLINSSGELAACRQSTFPTGAYFKIFKASPPVRDGPGRGGSQLFHRALDHRHCASADRAGRGLSRRDGAGESILPTIEKLFASRRARQGCRDLAVPSRRNDAGALSARRIR